MSFLPFLMSLEAHFWVVFADFEIPSVASIHFLISLVSPLFDQSWVLSFFCILVCACEPIANGG